jgi:hypothetical protein
MSFIRLKQLYITLLPIPFLYSTIVGVNIGLKSNMKYYDEPLIDTFSRAIGYTSVGVITGLTYPISFPLCGVYVLYKNHT